MCSPSPSLPVWLIFYYFFQSSNNHFPRTPAKLTLLFPTVQFTIKLYIQNLLFSLIIIKFSLERFGKFSSLYICCCSNALCTRHAMHVWNRETKQVTIRLLYDDRHHQLHRTLLYFPHSSSSRVYSTSFVTVKALERVPIHTQIDGKIEKVGDGNFTEFAG